jgi:hypothetical protein
MNGVPLLDPGQGALDEFIVGATSREHTKYDDGRDYDAASVDYKIMQDAALGMYVDKTPALVIDLSERVKLLTAEESLPQEPAEAKLKEYEAAAEKLGGAAKTLTDKAEQINVDYLAAYQEGDDAKMTELQAEAIALNKILLQAFRDGQDGFTALASWYGVQTPQQALMSNITILRDTLETIEGAYYKYALDVVGELWTSNEWIGMEFSEGTYKAMVDRMNNTSLSARGEDNWSTDRQSPVIDTYGPTSALVALAYGFGEPDYEQYIIDSYGAVLKTLEKKYSQAVDDVISGINEMTNYLTTSME